MSRGDHLCFYALPYLIPHNVHNFLATVVWFLLNCSARYYFPIHRATHGSDALGAAGQ